VTTDVGGAREVAARVPGVHLVPPDAGPDRYVEPLLAIAAKPGLSSAPMLRAQLSKERMASHCARLLRAVAGAERLTRREGLWLVTNNFSTGGAQTSARRLLLALRETGVKVRAAVIQEQPRFPTPGRGALIAAGVPVLAVPPPEEAPTDHAVDLLLEAIHADPPESVVLWNVIPEHKLLLADALFDTPVFDVSPGEMYFESLERYFAKPRPGFPYDTAADYGARLSGVIVKYTAEAERARQALGAPVHVIANGVPVRQRSARTPSNGRLRIGTLARLDPKKRVDLLLDALRLAAPRLPPYRLRIAGGAEPGSENHVADLHRHAEGLDVEFLGDVTDPEAFLRELDLFALVAEPAGCPNASLEAMGQGLPILATDVGGMREQIEDGVNGRLVSRHDPEALAEALVDLARNKEERSRLAEAGYARVSERFSLARMTESYRNVLLGQSRG
jgi:glycosyltransferase involved in cell wall biosynthesis